MSRADHNPLKVILADPQGFCFGVSRAIEQLHVILEKHGAPVFVYHPVVHNEFVLSSFNKKGVTFINDLSEYPTGSGRPLVASSHGISTDVEKEMRKRSPLFYDLTCPFVDRLHKEVLAKLADDMQVILIGTDPYHDENIGTLGQGHADGDVLFLRKAEEIPGLIRRIRDPRKLSYVTQTTLVHSQTEPVIAALRQFFPHIKRQTVDICKATQERQQAVRTLLSENKVDLFLVIGSRTSSNTQKLRAVALDTGLCPHVESIESAKDLDPDWLIDVETVGVTSGASTPVEIVDEVLEKLKA